MFQYNTDTFFFIVSGTIGALAALETRSRELSFKSTSLLRGKRIPSRRGPSRRGTGDVEAAVGKVLDERRESALRGETKGGWGYRRRGRGNRDDERSEGTAGPPLIRCKRALS